MPPRRRSVTEATLTTDDLAVLAAAVAEGRRATVYLREGTSSLRLAPGSSARVVSVDGNTVVVRPRGVNDELPYEADELRMTKNPRPAPKTETATPRSTPAATTAPARSTPARAARTTAPATTAPATTTAAKATAAKATATAPQKPATKPAAKKPAARRGPATSLTVTLYGSADNKWSVALSRGARKPQRSRPVTPEAVEAAARELGDADTTAAVSAVLSAARDAAQRRVEDLSRELEEARRALEALNDPSSG